MSKNKLSWWREARLGYLYLYIGRALARCGDVLGYEIMTECLADIRGVLAGSARQELSKMKEFKEKILHAKPFQRAID